jgi:hypothetical protein
LGQDVARCGRQIKAPRGCATLPAANSFRGLAGREESDLRLKGFN